MLKDPGWSWKRCIPHGGHQMSLNIAAGLGLGGNESYPDVFQPYGGPASRSPRAIFPFAWGYFSCSRTGGDFCCKGSRLCILSAAVPTPIGYSSFFFSVG